jgi:transposase
MTPQQLFTWRREARPKAEEDLSFADGFVPVVVEAKAAAGSGPAPPPRPPPPMPPHSIELDVGGTSAFIWPGAEPGMVRAIIGALKRAKRSARRAHSASWWRRNPWTSAKARTAWRR